MYIQKNVCIHNWKNLKTGMRLVLDLMSLGKPMLQEKGVGLGLGLGI